MERLQAYKFQLRPKAGQESLMRRFAGCCRFLWNKALALEKETYEKEGKRWDFPCSAKPFGTGRRKTVSFHSKLRNLPFETAIIERYRRRESSIEEAMMEMYLAGVSVRRVEDITEALWGAGVSAGTISNLNKKIYGSIEEWRNGRVHIVV